MKLQSVIASWTATAIALGAAGCSQFYNGAVDFDTASPNAAQPVHSEGAASPAVAPPRPALNADDALALQRHGRGATGPTSAPTDASTSPATRATTAAPDAPGRAVTAPTPPPPSDLAVLGLFGQLDEPTPGRSSPLDATGNLQRITSTVEGDDFDPAIDATGQRMVYASTRHRRKPDLYLKHVDGSTITQLTSDPAEDVMPAFSPDGQRVAFASRRSGNWDIYIIDVIGGQAVQVTDSPTHEIHPSFSPDGRQLVYCSYGSPSGQWEMVVVDLDNPGIRRIIGHGLFPVWSPTEDRILYQRARQRGTRWFSIWTVDLVDGEAMLPTEIAASANAAVITPEWSPDGERIVFCTVADPVADNLDRPAEADVWIVNADGTGRTRLSTGRFANLQPTWAADGTIYFVSDRAAGGAENIWAARPEVIKAIEAAVDAEASP